jgi:hypothetical protein
MKDQSYFDVFEDVKWHAVVIPTDFEEDALAFKAKVEVYREWCQEAYLAVNGGATPPEFPEELRIKRRAKKQSQSETQEG